MREKFGGSTVYANPTQYSFFGDMLTSSIEKNVLEYLYPCHYEDCLVSVLQDSEMENLWHLKMGLHNLGYVDIMDSKRDKGIYTDILALVRWCIRHRSDISGIVFSDRVGLWGLSGDNSVLVSKGYTFFPGCKVSAVNASGGSYSVGNYNTRFGSIQKLLSKFITVPQYSISSREDNMAIVRELSSSDKIVGTWRISDCNARQVVFECNDTQGNKSYLTITNISIGSKIL